MIFFCKIGACGPLIYWWYYWKIFAANFYMRCFDRRGNSTGKKLVRLNWEKAVYQPLFTLANTLFFFDNSIWVQLWKNLLPNQLCLFWMWNNMLVHFLRSICSQPPHVAHDHQKWLHMDLIHLFKMLVDFFLAAFDNFLRMFLQTCQMSNWWLILGRSSLIFFYLHMPVCCNLFYINISGLHAMQNFLKTIFLHSIWISTFSELCYWHCNDFINTMFQKGICQLFCIISWAITSSVTTKCTWMWLRNFRNHFFFLIDSSFISNSK